MAEEEKPWLDRIKEDRTTLAIAIAAILLIIFAVFAGITGVAPAKLSPPKNVEATVVGNSIHVTWEHSDDYPDPVIGYNVYLSTEEGVLGVLQNSEAIGDNKYVIKNVDPGTYYIVVRSVDDKGNEDGNMNQVVVEVKVVPPSDLSIKINDDAPYTNTRDVTLSLHAENAEECSYANEDGVWSAWEPYVEEKDWTLTENAQGCEEKTVYYKCRNAGGESEVVSDTIILDTVKPSVAFTILSREDNKLTLDVVVSDDCSNELHCYAYADDEQIADLGVIGGEQTVTVEVPYGSYLFTVACTDDAGNVGTSSLTVDISAPQNESEENETALTVDVRINNDEPTTDDLDVTLNLYAEYNGEECTECECRYSNDGATWTAWEAYATEREWTLAGPEDESGTRTVYYECRYADQTAMDTDTIYYDAGEGGEGGGGGGGEGGQGSPPSNLAIRIIGYRNIPGFEPHIQMRMKDKEASEDYHVLLQISSQGSDECKVWNEKYLEGVGEPNSEDEAQWDANLKGSTEISWELAPKIVITIPYPWPHEVVLLPDGERTVYLKCRNSYGESDIVNATIFYDATPPSKVSYVNAEYRTNMGSLPILNVLVSWTQTSDNSEGKYDNGGVYMYSVCRTYCSGSLCPRKPPENANWECKDLYEKDVCHPLAATCSYVDFQLPEEVTSNGGVIYYRVYAWDYVGHVSEGSEVVAVNIPSTPVEEDEPYIEWVEIKKREEVSPHEQPGYSEPGELASHPISDEYTNVPTVWVYVKARNAEKCVLWNDNVDAVPKSAWEDYVEGAEGYATYEWTLRDEEGERTVYVQCRKDGKLSNVEHVSIGYDKTMPTFYIEPIAQYRTALYRGDSYATFSKIGGFASSDSNRSGYSVNIIESGDEGDEVGFVELRFSAVDEGAYPSGIDHYNIYRAEKVGDSFIWGGEPIATVDSNNVSYTDYYIESGKTYKYRIEACDRAGNCNSAETNAVSVP